MKTIRQWLKEYLSDDDYKKAKKYDSEYWGIEKPSFESALSFAFTWYDTREGDDYWRGIHDNIGSFKTEPIVVRVYKDLIRRVKMGIKDCKRLIKEQTK